jgi:hypothetical protein
VDPQEESHAPRLRPLRRDRADQAARPEKAEGIAAMTDPEIVALIEAAVATEYAKLHTLMVLKGAAFDPATHPEFAKRDSNMFKLGFQLGAKWAVELCDELRKAKQ